MRFTTFYMVLRLSLPFAALTLAWPLSPTALAADQTLRVAVTALPPGGADPRKSVSVFATYAWSPLYEALTTFREDGTLAPELAVRWEQTRPTRWTFTLREGVTFSNGRHLTAQDVADNMAFFKDGDGSLYPLARHLDGITAARALDDRTVEIDTAKPNAILPRELSVLNIVEPDLWRTLGPDGFAKAPIGTGPFKVKRWAAGKIDYAPNPLSWRKPKVAGLEIRDLPESTTRLQALLTGQTDIAIGMGPEERSVIEDAGGRLHARQPIDVMSIAFVIGTGKPIDDVRVRRALNYAVDKNAIANVILQGVSRPATQGAVEGLLGYDPDLKPYPYDPAKARALLKEAGHEQGFTLNTEVIVSSNASDGLIYQYVAANLAAVNVTMNLTSIPTPQMARVVTQGEWRGDSFSQIFGAWPAIDPLRTIRMHSCLRVKPWYCDRGISATLQAAMDAPDLAQRARLTTEILRFYHDQATTLMLHEVPLIDGVAARVKNYAPQKAKINYETIELSAP